MYFQYGSSEENEEIEDIYNLVESLNVQGFLLLVKPNMYKLLK